MQHAYKEHALKNSKYINQTKSINKGDIGLLCVPNKQHKSLYNEKSSTFGEHEEGNGEERKELDIWGTKEETSKNKKLERLIQIQIANISLRKECDQQTEKQYKAYKGTEDEQDVIN